MNFTQTLQNQLREKKYLTINDVMGLSFEFGHYFDTGRRKLEDDITPFSFKEHDKKNRVKGWRYLPEKDIKSVDYEVKKEQGILL